MLWDNYTVSHLEGSGWSETGSGRRLGVESAECRVCRAHPVLIHYPGGFVGRGDNNWGLVISDEEECGPCGLDTTDNTI